MQNAHLAVIDSLMAVGAMETVTAVKACSSVELLGGASSWEDALLHWVNVVRRKPKKNSTCLKHTSLQSEITHCSDVFLPKTSVVDDPVSV